MEVFDRLAEHGVGDVHFVRDDSTQLRGIVAIHDTRLGPSLGGTRFVPYATDTAALRDVMRLASAMTSKAALANVCHGGGKAVIMKPPGAFDREALFSAFGRFVNGLAGRYITTEDSGTRVEDMEVVRKETAHVAGFGLAYGGSGDPSPFTALGVRRGIEACVKVAMGRSSLEGIRVSVQGVGNVGRGLCEELKKLGAVLTIADVREEVCAAAAQELGADVVPVSEIHRQECDVYAPCALGGAINDTTISELRCPIVAGAANNQLAEAIHGQQLLEKGILYAPDYAINAGGLINVAEEVHGYDAARSTQRTLDIYDTIFDIAERSIGESRATHEIADVMVAQRLAMK